MQDIRQAEKSYGIPKRIGWGAEVLEREQNRVPGVSISKTLTLSLRRKRGEQKANRFVLYWLFEFVLRTNRPGRESVASPSM